MAVECDLASWLKVLSGLPDGGTVLYDGQESPFVGATVSSIVKGSSPPEPWQISPNTIYGVTLLEGAPEHGYDAAVVVVHRDRVAWVAVAVGGTLLALHEDEWPSRLAFDPLDYQRPWEASQVDETTLSQIDDAVARILGQPTGE
jgi:hypothetical protein